MLSLSSTDSTIYVAGHYAPAFLMEFEQALLSELSLLTTAKNLDLSKLVGSDSGLIAVLLAFQRIANTSAWDVRLINANDGIKGLIKLSQLETFFTLSDS